MQKKQKKTTAKINEPKSWLSEKTDKVDKPLSQTPQEAKGEEPNQQSQNWKWRDHNRQHWNTKDHKNNCQQLYANKMDNLEEMEKFLEKLNVPKLNQGEIENPNRPITGKEIETVIFQ